MIKSAPTNELVHISTLIREAIVPPVSFFDTYHKLINAYNCTAFINKMTLKEKIGQKIMLDFRYWNELGLTDNRQDMIEITQTIKKIIANNYIGGIILFSNNLKNKHQIRRLTDSLREIATSKNIPLFIATDNEGGNVFRLPRGEFCSFAGNMALAATFENHRKDELAYLQSCVMAQDLLSVGINTNFAPVMDVNSNQDNPVINVRSFGDDPAVAGVLSRQMIKGLGDNHVVSVAKHFPGHGDTITDSHLGLPVVNRSRKEAETLDLAPYRSAIKYGKAPDMIMTAHIQYPALDRARVKTKTGENIIIPATLSRKIQTNLLRGTLRFTGVTITDALDMKAISDNFDIEFVMERVFKAGVDIALMPVSIRSPGDSVKLERMMDNLVKKINDGIIDKNAVSQSVNRIIALKMKRKLIDNIPAKEMIDISVSRRLEKYIANHSVTLLKNAGNILPFKNKTAAFYILMPWNEQGAAIKHTLSENGYCAVRHGKISDTPWKVQKKEIGQCVVLITGSLSDRAGPVAGGGPSVPPHNPAPAGGNAVRRAMLYAKGYNKKVIHISLKTPYDVVNHDTSADAVLATYSYYGDDHGEQRGRSLHAAGEIIIGKFSPRGTLPVNIYNLDEQGHAGQLKYPRGFGLSTRRR